MIASLYEPFKHWSESGSVWLISDPHFDDKDTKLMNSNWIEPEDYINVLNSMIYKNDTLVCLGDCGNLEKFKELKAGYKVLIKGNHDDKGDSKYLKNIHKFVYDADKYNVKDIRKKLDMEFPNAKISIIQSCEFHAPFNRWNVTVNDNLFDEVYSGALFISPQILISHEPIYGLKFCTNIHGHEHNGFYDYTDREGGRHLNIAADVIGYQPVNLGKLIKSGLVAGLPTIHRLTIDRVIENQIYK